MFLHLLPTLYVLKKCGSLSTSTPENAQPQALRSEGLLSTIPLQQGRLLRPPFLANFFATQPGHDIGILGNSSRRDGRLRPKEVQTINVGRGYAELIFHRVFLSPKGQCSSFFSRKGSANG